MQKTAPNAAPPLCLRRRRLVFSLLVVATMLLAIAAFAMVIFPGGLNLVELAMLALFTLNLPWVAIGLWNSLIGFALSWTPGGGLARVVPLAGLNGPPRPLFGRVAIVMPVCDEDPACVFRGLRASIASLDATGRGEPFDVFLLSDTRDPDTAAEEMRLFAAWRAQDPRPARLHWRRRADTQGFKAGNIREFCETRGRDYACMIVLDADSVMSGTAILRLAGLMQDNPRLGILQTLVVGLPSRSPFARMFQFGMRQGMRVYTMGSAWWQGDAGPYWGHNAIIRLAPFIEHCHLPPVPGRPPLGGDVLSHDQLEAVMMRKAGWEVRVLPVEDGSWEANPPTLPDYIRRDLRWCLGNMQYTRLMPLAGGNRMGRVQMILAVLMYTSAPCWLAFCLLGLMQPALLDVGVAPILLEAPAWLPVGASAGALGLGLFVSMFVAGLAPKLLGVLQVLTLPALRRRWGGAGRVAAGGGLELVFSMLMAPVAGLAQTVFMVGLLAGRRLTWASQRRGAHKLSLAEASRRLWPQTLLGLGALASLALLRPEVLWWTAPPIAALLLAIPFAVVSSDPRLGRRLAALRLFATPDEFDPAPEVLAVCPWLRTAARAASRPRPADATLGLAAAPAAEREPAPVS